MIFSEWFLDKKNPILWLSLISVGLGIVNITTHFTVVCGLQSIGLYLGANC